MSISEFYKLIVMGDYYNLLLLSFLVLAVILFKDTKKTLLNNKTEDQKFLEESINVYARLLKTIYLFQKEKVENDVLFDEISIGYRYLDDDIIEKVMDLINNIYLSKEELEKRIDNLRKDIEKKLHYLKGKQGYSLLVKKNQSTIDQFEEGIRKNNFEIYLKALIYTFFILLIIFMFIVICSKSMFTALIFLLAMTLYMFSLVIACDLLLRYHKKKIIAFILEISAFFVCIFIGGIIQNKIAKFIVILIFVIYQIIQLRVNIKEINMNRKLNT